MSNKSDYKLDIKAYRALFTAAVLLVRPRGPN
jgi:hypothetical protein